PSVGKRADAAGKRACATFGIINFEEGFWKVPTPRVSTLSSALGNRTRDFSRGLAVKYVCVQVSEVRQRRRVSQSTATRRIWHWSVTAACTTNGGRARLPSSP